MHTILFNQQFDISQVILDTMTPLHDPFFRWGTFPFILLISQIIKDVGIKIDHTLGVQAIPALLDRSSQAKHYNHAYKLMTPPTHYGPQDLA